MKKKYYIFTAIATYFLFLTATIPAQLALSLFNDNTPVKIQGISGTLWSGNAYAVSINNTVELNSTEWSFSLWKLLIGQIAADINTLYSGNRISAEIGTSFSGHYFINDLTAELPAEDAAGLANIPLAQLSGVISVNIDHAQWVQGSLPTASGQINWKNAAITLTETASLGNVLITLGESDKQLLNADIKNQGGDIKITGTAELIPQANYAVNLLLSPTESASSNISQGLAMFANRQSSGDYLFKKSGALNQIGLF